MRENTAKGAISSHLISSLQFDVLTVLLGTGETPKTVMDVMFDGELLSDFFAQRGYVPSCF